MSGPARRLALSLCFVAGFCAWWPGVLVMIATGDPVATLIHLLGAQYGANLLTAAWPGNHPRHCFLSRPVCPRFCVTQNFVNIVFLAYGGAILLIAVLGTIIAFQARQVVASPWWIASRILP